MRSGIPFGGGLVVVVVVVAVAIVLLGGAGSAHAQLALRSSTLVNGNVAVVGNVVVDCPTSSTCDNNTTVLVPVDRDPLALGDLDHDGDDDTTASSAATLKLPTGAVVKQAMLYVGAFGNDVTQAPMAPQWLTDVSDESQFRVLFPVAHRVVDSRGGV